MSWVVRGLTTGKIYFRSDHKAECSRWINEQSHIGNGARANAKQTLIDLSEPLRIVKTN